MVLVLVYTVPLSMYNGFARKKNKEVLRAIFHSTFILFNDQPHTIMPSPPLLYVSDIFSYILMSGEGSP